MTELIPGAGPPLTTIPKHLRVSADVISRTHKRANLYFRHWRLILEIHLHEIVRRMAFVAEVVISATASFRKGGG
jgi:hypothetical protein